MIFLRFLCLLGIRLLRFDRKNWRASYNSLILLEHLLTHGPESVADEFQSEKGVIEGMESFQYIDEKGSVLIFPFLGFVLFVLLLVQGFVSNDWTFEWADSTGD